MSKNTDICIYARYSTDRQDARSIDDQVRRCTEYAKNHALTVGTVFPDAAISGSHVERDELKKMLAEAESLRTRSFNAVIVDDLARLSRDLFDMGRIVFQDLLALDVRVIDAMSGISSDHPMARQIFAAMGMGNDAFLQLVRSETHRGLQGRAIAGFWTGGRVFGYRTIPEPNPPDPEHVRKLLVIDETTSKIVVLIFTLFHEGYGLGAISDRLNRDGIPAPYDNLAKLTKKQGRGWAPSTVRAILLNERYIGRFIWNKRKFARVPKKKSKRASLRPKEEWTIRERPDLAIVPIELWDATRKRFQKGRARAFGASNRENKPHLFSGIARCGTCSTGLGVIGQKMKAGVRYITFGCRSHHSRGGSICPNTLTISEMKLNGWLLSGLKDQLLAAGAIKRFREQFNAAVGKQSDTAPSPTAQIDREIFATQKAVANLTDAFAQMGFSPAVATKLKTEEDRLQKLMSRRAELAAEKARVPSVPTEETVEKYLTGLFKACDEEPAKARVMLASHFKADPLVLTPQNNGPDRFYEATGAFFLWTTEVLGKSLCGG